MEMQTYLEIIREAEGFMISHRPDMPDDEAVFNTHKTANII